MSVEFSAKIAMLRKQNDLTQRQAAEALGISQALLSHYEKGIRECSLSFVKKCAEYYDVSCDFLLGLTETPKPQRGLFLLEETQNGQKETPDVRILTQAVYDILRQTAEQDTPEENGSLRTFLSLTLRHYLLLRDNDQKKRLKSEFALRKCALEIASGQSSTISAETVSESFSQAAAHAADYTAKILAELF